MVLAAPLPLRPGVARRPRPRHRADPGHRLRPRRLAHRRGPGRPSSGVRSEGKVGKPGTLVGLRTDAFQIVAVDLADDEHMHGAVLDLVRRGAHPPLRPPSTGATGEAAVDALLEPLPRRSSPPRPVPVLGVGVGSPGVIDPSGTVRRGAQPRLVRPRRSPTGSAPPSACRCTSPTTPTPRRSASSPTAARPAAAAGPDRRRGRRRRASCSTARSCRATSTRPASSATSPPSTSATTSTAHRSAARNRAPAAGAGCLETVLSRARAAPPGRGSGHRRRGRRRPRGGRPAAGHRARPGRQRAQPAEVCRQRPPGAPGRAALRGRARRSPRTHHAGHQQQTCSCG